MCSFTADCERSRGNSPDRVDAPVWALSELMVEAVPGWGVVEYYKRELARAACNTPVAPPPVTSTDDGLIIPNVQRLPGNSARRSKRRPTRLS